MTGKQISVIAFALIIGLIYLGVFITFFGDDNSSKNLSDTDISSSASSSKKTNSNKELIMLFNSHLIIKYQNNKFYYLKNNSEYTKYKFDLYDNNEYIGEYSAQYNEKEDFYDENNNLYEPTGNFLAITGNVNYTIKDINTEAINDNDNEIFQKVLKENNITSKSPINKYKYLVDINNDNNNEVIYIIDNSNIENTYGETNSYTYVFTYINNKINYIYKYKESISKNSDMCTVNLKNVIDINNDNNNEIILSCTLNENKGACLNIYQYDNNKFNKVLDCNL